MRKLTLPLLVLACALGDLTLPDVLLLLAVVGFPGVVGFLGSVFGGVPPGLKRGVSECRRG